MLTVKVQDKKYLVRFVHDDEEALARLPQKLSKFGIKTVNHITDCYVLLDISTNGAKSNSSLLTVGKGRSQCHSGDNFSKNKGRKMSLLRALKNADIKKPDRFTFWSTYRAMRNGKW